VQGELLGHLLALGHRLLPLRIGSRLAFAAGDSKKENERHGCVHNGAIFNIKRIQFHNLNEY
jgi:hypothetical protein